MRTIHYAFAVLLGLSLGFGAALYAHLAEAQTGTVIVQQGIAFKPGTATVKAGGQITFRNEDPFGHNVMLPQILRGPTGFAAGGLEVRLHPHVDFEVAVGHR